MKKYGKLFMAMLHAFRHDDIVIQHIGKANEYIPVTHIYCEKCGKIFYENKEFLNKNRID